MKANPIVVMTWIMVGTSAVFLGAIIWMVIGMMTVKQPDWTAYRIEDMKFTCEHSYKVIDGQQERACGAKIDALQADGYEVLSKDGKFWVER